MRYPQGGGLTAEWRAFREHVRLEAAGMFAAGLDTAVVAEQPRVSVRSLQRWRRAWQDRGQRALGSKGPASHPSLSKALFTVLEEELAREPAAHGWENQTWILERIRSLTGRRFPKTLTLSAITQMLRRHRRS
ncbi:helix-turn-helix domain-containing protein, partial [Streptomyces sp. NPDC001719]